MRREEIVVRCIYAKDENCLQDLVEESFHLFINRALARHDGKMMSSQR
ncbi:MAG TPA: hypothetical protein IAC21_01755 [Candidatus Enterenecus merdae]|mgnify:CR=1 FL=1|nr:hypothetical protein [Candidatus Enterenecus merdae]